MSIIPKRNTGYVRYCLYRVQMFVYITQLRVSDKIQKVIVTFLFLVFFSGIYYFILHILKKYTFFLSQSIDWSTAS